MTAFAKNSGVLRRRFKLAVILNRVKFLRMGPSTMRPISGTPSGTPSGSPVPAHGSSSVETGSTASAVETPLRPTPGPAIGGATLALPAIRSTPIALPADPETASSGATATLSRTGESPTTQALDAVRPDVDLPVADRSWTDSRDNNEWKEALAENSAKESWAEALAAQAANPIGEQPEPKGLSPTEDDDG